jgi:branched-subunit amino acid transport protein
MSAFEVWLAIIGMTFVTGVTRAFFLIGGERTVLPERVQRTLRYAPAAALVAVIAPELVMTEHGFSLWPSNHALWAALAGLAWYLWRRSMVGCIVSGVVVFNVLRLLF